MYVFGGIYRDEDDDKEVLMEDFFMLKADGDTVIAEAIPLKGAWLCRKPRLRHSAVFCR